MANWIWHFGDFECWHNLQLHLRRDENDYVFPPFWRLDAPWHNVVFRKDAEVAEDGEFTVFANGTGMLEIDGKRHPFSRDGKPVTFPIGKGRHHVEAKLVSDTLPCMILTGALQTDATWEACTYGGAWMKVGCSDLFTRLTDWPLDFPFEAIPLTPVSVEAVDGGTLYDYGCETFAEVEIALNPGETALIRYGESRLEAVSDQAYLQERVPAYSARAHRCKARAFRYVWVSGGTVGSVSEMLLKVNNRGAFRCSDGTINRIWDVSLRTFHLCSREFFLDGVKRDRWVWSGDAYQSYFINRYCFADREIDRRTILALRGKDPVGHHVNTILDYSLYWVMALCDYRRATADDAFVRQLWPMAVTLMDYVLDRLDDRGLAANEGNGWIFIDWADLDKEYALCAEQLLLIRALQVMGDLADAVGEDARCYRARAEKLRVTVDELFWDEEKGAYIDSYASGRRHVTRHANIFALRFNLVDEERRARILRTVLMNDAVPAIRTPYFKFYELDALAENGDLPEVTKRIRDYWGAMIRDGATSIWEEYAPDEPMESQYGMYGDAFGKSQCHAWGASPVYLCGRWYLGVTPTGDGWRTFDVRPNLGGLDWIDGVVPLPGGEVHVRADKNGVTVTTNADGGTLHYAGQTVALKRGETVHLPCGQ